MRETVTTPPTPSPATAASTWTVGELANLAGVSVRTLHHYHQIGLLLPAHIGDNGYRSYGPDELVRLQQILFFRELEFPLDRIRALLDHPDFDAIAAYRDHRRLLVARRGQIDRLIATLDDELAKRGDLMMDANDPVRISDRYTNEELAGLQEEAKQRWGDTDAWKQSQDRTKGYPNADYKRMEDDNRARLRALVADMANGIASPEVQAHIRNHREHLRQFYEPNNEMYRCLGNMYVDDDRFAAYFREIDPRLPEFLRDAMHYSVGDRS